MSALGLRGVSRGLRLSPRGRAAKSPEVPGIVQEGLVAEWRFDDGAGQALTDYSGNGHHGQLGATTGADASDPTWTAQGLSFDGDDRVELPTLPAVEGFDLVFLPSETITKTSPRRMLLRNVGGDSGVTFGTNFASTLLTDEVIGLRQVSAQGYAANAAISPLDSYTLSAAWHLLQMDYRSGSTPAWNLLIDGVSANPSASANPAVPFLSGSWWVGNSQFFPFTGSIAYLIFYGAARTDEQQDQNREALETILAARGITLP